MERTGLVLGMSDAEYHLGPELSSTGARHILDAPARYHWRKEHPEFSNALNFGKLAHLKVLGVGADVVEIPEEHLTPAGKLSTKAATREWLAEQGDATLVAPADLKKADAIAEAVLAHRGARELLERPGSNEVSVFATDPVTGVLCRARYDRLDHIGGEVAIDFKTTSGSASATGFGVSAARYGYAVQEAFYADVLRWTGREAPAMHFIVAETSAPYLVAVHQFSAVDRLAGAELAKRARQVYAECAERDEWPGYGDAVIETRIPGWFADQIYDDMEMEVA